jgi:dual 3',5'-cyclic-AMP and -GMP phosphodiesterase 11
MFLISNITLLSFLKRISARYRNIPCFNWSHAVETCQFCAWQLQFVQHQITKREILNLLVASLCHDVAHDGFSRKNEIWESIRGSQSPYEVRHCLEAIEILSDPECHILSDNGYGIIDLIMATDMARHFEILRSFTSCSKNFQKTDDRLLFMKMMLKAADLNECCRPWEDIDGRKVMIAEEFFMQGDLGLVPGLVYEDGCVGDRQKLIKLESFIPFLEKICFPIFDALDRVCEDFDSNTVQMQMNLRHWRRKREGSAGSAG